MTSSLGNKYGIVRITNDSIQMKPEVPQGPSTAQRSATSSSQHNTRLARRAEQDIKDTRHGHGLPDLLHSELDDLPGLRGYVTGKAVGHDPTFPGFPHAVPAAATAAAAGVAAAEAAAETAASCLRSP